jgi:ligand-binding sensor domain-containing protein
LPNTASTTGTTDNGLPQNEVPAITQTPDGYLWFATNDGLVRYDGVRFTVFDQGNSKGLRSNRFKSLYVDGAGTLWAGTDDGGLVRYRDGAFTSLTTADGLPDNDVSRVQSDGAGGLLMITLKGWVRYHDGAFSLYSPDNVSLFKVYFGPSGTRWTWDAAGLHQARDGHEITYAVPADLISSVWMLYEDRTGTLWVVSSILGVFRVKDGTVTRYGAKDGLPSNVNVVCEDRLGNIWFGTSGHGPAAPPRRSLYCLDDCRRSVEQSGHVHLRGSGRHALDRDVESRPEPLDPAIHQVVVDQGRAGRREYISHP